MSQPGISIICIRNIRQCKHWDTAKDYIRGYELRVIDGSHFALGKFELKYRLVNANYKFATGVKNYEKLPVCVYLTGFIDAGYVRNFREMRQASGNNLLPNSLQNEGGWRYQKCEC